MIIDKARFNPSKRAEFSVKFKTMASDGLLFLMGDPDEKDFLSLQIKDGHILLKV